MKKHDNALTNMRTQQKAANAARVAWLSINSGASGKKGAIDGKAAIASITALQSAPSVYVIESDGKVGCSCDTKTTPYGGYQALRPACAAKFGVTSLEDAAEVRR